MSERGTPEPSGSCSRPRGTPPSGRAHVHGTASPLGRRVTPRDSVAPGVVVTSARDTASGVARRDLHDAVFFLAPRRQTPAVDAAAVEPQDASTPIVPSARPMAVHDADRAAIELVPGSIGRGALLGLPIVARSIARVGATTDTGGEADFRREQPKVVVRGSVDALGDVEEIVPAGIEPRVDEPRWFATGAVIEISQQRELTEPLEQGGAIGSGVEFLQCVALPRPSTAFGEQRVDLVIADDPLTADARPETQGGQAIGPSIDEIAEDVELVVFGVESNHTKELVELPRAPLNVADDPTHPRSVAERRGRP